MRAFSPIVTAGLTLALGVNEAALSQFTHDPIVRTIELEQWTATTQSAQTNDGFVFRILTQPKTPGERPGVCDTYIPDNLSVNEREQGEHDKYLLDVSRCGIKSSELGEVSVMMLTLGRNAWLPSRFRVKKHAEGSSIDIVIDGTWPHTRSRSGEELWFTRDPTDCDGNLWSGIQQCSVSYHLSHVDRSTAELSVPIHASIEVRILKQTPDNCRERITVKGSIAQVIGKRGNESFSRVAYVDMRPTRIQGSRPGQILYQCEVVYPLNLLKKGLWRIEYAASGRGGTCLATLPSTPPYAFFRDRIRFTDGKSDCERLGLTHP